MPGNFTLFRGMWARIWKLLIIPQIAAKEACIIKERKKLLIIIPFAEVVAVEANVSTAELVSVC